MTEPIDQGRLDWDVTAAALASARPWISPAELHGLLCGSVCAQGQAPGDDDWLQRVWQHAGEDLADGADHGELFAFRARAVANLEAEAFDFDLVVPGEDAPLDDRVQAVASWCAGFLSGYGLGGGSTALEPDAVMALEDFAAIARVDPEVDESEQDEADLVEVVEYVRMGVLVILDAVRAGDGGGSGDRGDPGDGAAA